MRKIENMESNRGYYRTECLKVNMKKITKARGGVCGKAGPGQQPRGDAVLIFSE